jgi:hypothetical protein
MLPSRAKAKNRTASENSDGKFAPDEDPKFVNDERSSLSKDNNQPIKVSLEISYNYNVALRQVRDTQSRINEQLFETIGLNSAL